MLSSWTVKNYSKDTFLSGFRHIHANRYYLCDFGNLTFDGYSNFCFRNFLQAIEFHKKGAIRSNERSNEMKSLRMG